MSKLAKSLPALFLALAAVGPAATITPVQPSPNEADLVEILDGLYGPGGYYRVDDALDFGWTAGQINVRAVGSHTWAAANLGYCIVCDGTDDVYSDQVFAGEGALSTPLTFGSSTNLVIGSQFAWFNSAQFHPFVGQVYSTGSLNADGQDHAVTYGIIGQPNLFVLAFEDWFFTSPTPSDGDYQDFIVEVTYLTAPPAFHTPEPGGLLLMAGGLAALFFVRKRTER